MGKMRHTVLKFINLQQIAIYADTLQLLIVSKKKKMNAVENSNEILYKQIFFSFSLRGSYIYMKVVIIKQLFSIFQNVDNHYQIKKQSHKNHYN
jgi:hypothetical protein